MTHVTVIQKLQGLQKKPLIFNYLAEVSVVEVTSLHHAIAWTRQNEIMSSANRLLKVLRGLSAGKEGG